MIINTEIHAENIHSLKEKFKKYESKCKKHGLPIPKLIISDEYIIKKSGDESWLAKQVTIEGEEIKINGYKLIGLIEIENVDGEDQNKVSQFTDELIPEKFINTNSFICDHCKTKRNRNSKFIFRNESNNELIQIGKTCFREYAGIKPNDLIDYLRFPEEIQDELMEEFENEKGFRGSIGFDLEKFMQIAYYDIKDYGWISRQKAETEILCSTADSVVNYFTAPKREKEYVISDECKEFVQKAISRWKDIPINQAKNAFEQNMILTANSKKVSFGKFGFAAYMVEHEFRQNITKRDLTASRHIGKIKDKIEIDIEVISYNFTQGMYGTTHIYNMVDESNNVYVWFASDNPLEKGDKVKIKGTIKDHGEYKGIKNTVLTRCKVVD